MAKDTRYLKNLSVPYQLTDEKYTDVGSGELTMGDQKRAFKGSTDFVIRTASGGGGTLLVEGTDYNLINSDSALTTEAGYTVYTGWQVINATYQSGDLYVTYKTVGTYTGASIINSIIDGWIDINDTLSYASATTINTVYDLTGILEPGMKLKITQPTDGTKYFTILVITSSLITINPNTYDLDNEAITSPQYSLTEEPYGWPYPPDGWENVLDTLTYASATTITTGSDLTGILEPGMKLKITQPTDGVKYFTVQAITSSLITVATATYDLDNEAITNPCYSHSYAPFGWPDPDGKQFGEMYDYGGTTPPHGSLVQDGSAISRTEYALLFAKIGTAWGVGDGSTTFNIPDGRAMFRRGAGTHGTLLMADGNSYSGPAVGSSELDQGQGHWHRYLLENELKQFAGTADEGEQTVQKNPDNTNYMDDKITDPVTDGVNGTPRMGDEHRPVAIGVLPCIKAY